MNQSTNGVVVAPLGARFGAAVIDRLGPALISGGYYLLRSMGVDGWLIYSVAAALLLFAWTMGQWWAYATRKAGLGYKLFRLELVGLADGKPIGWGRMALRTLIYSALWALVIPGIVMAIFLVVQERRQGWHDLAVGSLAIARRKPQAAATAAVVQQPSGRRGNSTVGLPPHLMNNSFNAQPDAVPAAPIDRVPTAVAGPPASAPMDSSRFAPPSEPGYGQPEPQPWTPTPPSPDGQQAPWAGGAQAYPPAATTPVAGPQQFAAGQAAGGYPAQQATPGYPAQQPVQGFGAPGQQPVAQQPMVQPSPAQQSMPQQPGGFPGQPQAMPPTQPVFGSQQAPGAGSAQPFGQPGQLGQPGQPVSVPGAGFGGSAAPVPEQPAPFGQSSPAAGSAQPWQPAQAAPLGPITQVPGASQAPAPAQPVPVADQAMPAQGGASAPLRIKPRAVPDDDIDGTRLVAHPSRTARPATEGWHLRLDDGRDINVKGLVLIGRSPEPRDDEVGTTLVPAGEPGRTVSKTHLAIGVDQRGIYVVDRGSTNGTALLNAKGELDPCSANSEVRVTEGQVVSFGERQLQVLRYPAGRD